MGGSILNFWPRGHAVDQIERLATEVIPAVRDQLSQASDPPAPPSKESWRRP